MVKLKFYILYFILIYTNLSSNNIININVIVATHANIKVKVMKVNNREIRQNIYLENNSRGLTIALTNKSYNSLAQINNTPLSINPKNFSDNIYSKFTKVAELIISQKKNKGSLGITIFAK